MSRLNVLIAAGFVCLLPALPAAAQTDGLLGPLTPMTAPSEAGSHRLYPDQPAGTSGEIWERTAGGEPWVRNVAVPTITPVLPPHGLGNGVAVIVAPGGAFRTLSAINEGMAAARWFADRGIAAFVLKYRLEPTPANPRTYQAELRDLLRRHAAGLTTVADFEPPEAAVADGQAAVRWVRERASTFEIDAGKVGFIGFSAGAITALAVATRAPEDARPDFVVPLYPTMLAVPVPSEAPPMFLALASDDPLFGAQGLGLPEAWRAAGRPVEFHLFERGAHGFGMRRQDLTSDAWTRLLQDWMHLHGWAPASDETVAP